MLPDKKLLLYFLLILLLSAAGNFLILKNADLLQQHLAVWYLLHILWIVSIVYAGYSYWKSHPKKWLVVLWLGMYLLAGFIFFILGVVDLFIHRFPNVIRKDISKIRVFCFSPMPFIILYFISRLKISNPASDNNS